ncbi:MAG: hypothetical protein J0I41_13110 [Filimonas sp.]|nr:hypothetical protein [Filimonas sp.]
MYSFEPQRCFLQYATTRTKRFFVVRKICILFFLSFLFSFSYAQRIVVDINGKGDFKTIQDAINSLSDSSAKPRTIYIKKGTYKEKIFIAKSNIIFIGEDKQTTVITNAIARDEWRCDHPDDWGVATINLKGSDITLQNLTISNTYGFDNKNQPDRIIACNNDTATHQRKISYTGHQMALRSFETTRLKVINCNLKAFAGDTVSPWNTVDGMFYFKDCQMEGGVDFYCPRGWAYAENCDFKANTGDAAIWHDGSGNIDSKTVLKNCRFTGYNGFKLGRYHKEAQFYLLDCVFADNMADLPIYKVTSTPLVKWGERIYYFNCHRTSGKDFGWHNNNITADKAATINAEWVFGNKWKM